MKGKKIYLLFDSRYRRDEDSATFHKVCDTLKEAIDSAPDYGHDTVIVEAEIKRCVIYDTKILN